MSCHVQCTLYQAALSGAWLSRNKRIRLFFWLICRLIYRLIERVHWAFRLIERSCCGKDTYIHHCRCGGLGEIHLCVTGFSGKVALGGVGQRHGVSSHCVRTWLPDPSSCAAIVTTSRRPRCPRCSRCVRFPGACPSVGCSRTASHVWSPSWKNQHMLLGMEGVLCRKDAVKVHLVHAACRGHDTGQFGSLRCTYDSQAKETSVEKIREDKKA